jgi:hypothetical protein
MWPEKTIQNGGGPTKNFTGPLHSLYGPGRVARFFFRVVLAFQVKFEPERKCQNFLKIDPEIFINYSILFEFLQKWTGTVLRSFAISKRSNCIRKLAQGNLTHPPPTKTHEKMFFYFHSNFLFFLAMQIISSCSYHLFLAFFFEVDFILTRFLFLGWPSLVTV